MLQQPGLDQVKTLLKAPRGSTAYTLIKDESADNWVTSFIIREDITYIDKLPAIPRIDFRSSYFTVPASILADKISKPRADVLVLVTILRIEGKLYETWWNWHDPPSQECLTNLVSQNNIVFGLFSNNETPDRMIRLPNVGKEKTWKEIKENLEKKPYWSPLEFDAAMEFIRGDYPTVHNVWEFISPKGLT